jgi:hypothetical protein
VFFMGGRDHICVMCLVFGCGMDASCFLLACIPHPSPHNTATGACLFSPSLDTLISQGSVSWQCKGIGHTVHTRGCPISCNGVAPIRRADRALARGLDKDFVREHDLTGSYVQGSPAGFRSLRSPRSLPYFCLATRVVGVSSLRRPPSGFCCRATTEKRWATTSWSFLPFSQAFGNFRLCFM